MLAAMQHAAKGRVIYTALQAGLHAVKNPPEFPVIVMANQERLQELQRTVNWKTMERLRKPLDKLWSTAGGPYTWGRSKRSGSVGVRPKRHGRFLPSD